MRLTVLADNNASRNLMGEWGLSFWIESEGQKILFDLGASDLFLRNAARLNIDPLESDTLVLSHGHYDHTWGLEFWLKQRAKIPAGQNRPVLFAHPLTVQPKFRTDMTESGIMASESTLACHFQTKFAKEPVHLTEKLIFLGEIERQFPFENTGPFGKILDADGSLHDDYLTDDTALVYRTTAGLVIITGCSHSGVCNIVEYARKVCNEERVADIIGGFHLLKLKPGDPQLDETVNYLRRLNPGRIHPCHCTDLQAKIALAQAAPLEEVTAGFTTIGY